MLHALLFLAFLSPGQKTGDAPISLLHLADVDPLTFVQLLAEAAVPAGAELRESNRLPSFPRRWDPYQLVREVLMRESRVPLDEVIAAFNRSHTDYAAGMIEGVLVIRPVVARTAYLDRQRLSGTLSEQGLLRFAKKVFAPLDPRLDSDGGWAGSRLGPIGIEVDHGDDVRLVIGADGLTALQVLNDIARFAPGHAWLVYSETPPGGGTSRPVRFGFAHRYGVSETMGIRD